MYESQVRPEFHGRKLVAQQRNRHHSELRSYLRTTPSLIRDQISSRTLSLATFTVLSAATLSLLTGCGSLNYNTIGAANSQALSAVSCGTQSLTGAQSKTCSISLNAPALSLTTVKLSSDNSALQVPAEVKIAVGESSASFNAVTADVKKTATATITASSKGVTKKAAMTLYPASAATLASISCPARNFAGPTATTCSVHLGAPASSATSVTLSSSSSAVQVPSAVTVSSGSDAAQFAASISAVSNLQNVTLTAAAGGITQTFAITLQTSSTQASGPHKVQLNWSAPNNSEQTIVGYNIYRAVTDVSSYALLTSLDPQTSFTDANVQGGTTYDYVVKSVDSKGMESGPSNSTRVTIP